MEIFFIIIWDSIHLYTIELRIILLVVFYPHISLDLGGPGILNIPAFDLLKILLSVFSNGTHCICVFLDFGAGFD